MSKVNRIGKTIKGTKFLKTGDCVKFVCEGFNEIEGEYVGDNVLRGTSVTFNPTPMHGIADVIDLVPFKNYEFTVISKPAWIR